MAWVRSNCLSSYTEMGAWKPSAGRWKAMQMPLPAQPQRHCQLPNLWLGRGASMKHDETGAKDVFLQRVQRNVDIRNWESWFTSEVDVEHSTMLFENCKKISKAFGFMYSFHHENPNRQQLQRISRYAVKLRWDIHLVPPALWPSIWFSHVRSPRCPLPRCPHSPRSACLETPRCHGRAGATVASL